MHRSVVLCRALDVVPVAISVLTCAHIVRVCHRSCAYWHRVQALEGAGRLADALKELKLLLSLDKKNSAAVDAARRVAAALQAEMQDPVRGAREAVAAFVALVDGDVSDGSSDDGDARMRVVLRTDAACSASAELSRQFVAAGGVAAAVVVAWHDAGLAAAVFRVLRSCMKHVECVAAVLSGPLVGSASVALPSAVTEHCSVDEEAPVDPSLAHGLVPVLARSLARSADHPAFASLAVEMMEELCVAAHSVLRYVLSAVRWLLVKHVVVDVSGAAASDSHAAAFTRVRCVAVRSLSRMCATSRAARDIVAARVLHATVRHANAADGDLRAVSERWRWLLLYVSLVLLVLLLLLSLWWCWWWYCCFWCCCFWWRWCQWCHSLSPLLSLVRVVSAAMCPVQAVSSFLTQCIRSLLDDDFADTAAAGAGSDGARSPSKRTAAQKREDAQARRDMVKALLVDLCADAMHRNDDDERERVALRADDVERAAVVIRVVFLLNRDLGLWVLEQVRLLACRKVCCCVTVPRCLVVAVAAA